jgi:hypothetical protein
MNHADFEQIVEARVKSIKALLLKTKAKEYSTEQDRLYNFYRSAQISGKHPVACLEGFMLKHLTSIYDVIEAAQKGQIASVETVNEKVGDAINYLILLEALLCDLRK